MKKLCSYLALICVAFLFSSEIFAQKGIKPRILKRVSSEKNRDSKLEAAIVKAAEIESNDKDTRYFYNRVDLNGDKEPEVLVYLFGAENCGTGGCNALVLQKAEDSYKLITFFGPVRNPVIVSQSKTKGWNDLVFFNVGGGIINGYYSVCRFNGTTYPDNPTVEDDAPPLRKTITGTSYLEGKGYGASGLSFLFSK